MELSEHLKVLKTWQSELAAAWKRLGGERRALEDELATLREGHNQLAFRCFMGRAPADAIVEARQRIREIEERLAVLEAVRGPLSQEEKRFTHYGGQLRILGEAVADLEACQKSVADGPNHAYPDQVRRELEYKTGLVASREAEADRRLQLWPGYDGSKEG